MIAESENPTDSIPHPLASARPPAPAPLPTPADTDGSAFSPLNATGEGDDLVEAARPHLAFLSELAGHLGVIDPVETYLTPLVARWDDLRDEADVLRKAANTTGTVAKELSDDLGRLDAGWEGKDADAFVVYLGAINAAGADVEDALTTLAGALDELVLSLRRILTDLVEILVDTAELTSETAMLPVGGVQRARTQVEETQESAKALFEAARDVLEGFVRLCDGVDGPDVASRSIEITHRYPSQQFKLHENSASAGAPTPDEAAADFAAPEADDPVDQDAETTSPAAADGDPSVGRKTGTQDPAIEQGQAFVPEAAPVQAAAAAHGQASGGMGSGMMPMGMAPMGAMGAGGGSVHQAKTRPASKPSDVVGEPGQVVPPVIGEDDAPAKPDPKVAPKPKPAK